MCLFLLCHCRVLFHCVAVYSSSVGEILVVSHFLAIANSASVSILVHGFGKYTCISSRYIFRREMCGS